MNNLEKQQELLNQFRTLIHQLEVFRKEYGAFPNADSSEKAQEIAFWLRMSHTTITRHLRFLGLTQSLLKDDPRNRLIGRDEWSYCPVCGTSRVVQATSNPRFFKCHSCEAEF